MGRPLPAYSVLREVTVNVNRDTTEFRELKAAINVLHMEFDIFKAVVDSDHLRGWQAERVSVAIMAIDALSADLVK